MTATTVESGPTARLDLLKEISDVGCSESRSGRRGCSRWPQAFRLISNRGEVVEGRCRSANKCEYCGRLGAIENAEMLQLDALETGGPSVWCVLTTRTPSSDPKPFYESRRQVFRAVRRRWPKAEYAALVEFTTGYGPKSEGLRRPHWNIMFKGVPEGDVDELKKVVLNVWCGRENALPRAQHVGTIHEAGGLMRYLALHFQKESQQPPEGWRGHRFVKSRGFFNVSASEQRTRAKESLWERASFARAYDRGLEGLDAELAVKQDRKNRDETSWAFAWTHGDHGEPLTPMLRTESGVFVGASRRLFRPEARICSDLHTRGGNDPFEFS